jgi:hypothetical protein
MTDKDEDTITKDSPASALSDYYVKALAYDGFEKVKVVKGKKIIPGDDGTSTVACSICIILQLFALRLGL